MGGTAQEQLVKYLADAYAMEQQSRETLRAAVQIAGDPEISATYRGHLGETEEHISMVGERLEAHGESPSKLKDLAAKAGALGLGAAITVAPDSPGKLAAAAYGYESFEVASYELLRRLAERAGDRETVEVADRILAQERSAVEKISWSFDRVAALAVDENGSGG